MGEKKRIRERGVTAVSGSGGFKSLFVELNSQLQSYLEALKTASGEQGSN